MRSQVIIPAQNTVRDSNVRTSGDEVEEKPPDTKAKPPPKSKVAILRRILTKVVHGLVKGKPLMPVLVGKESSESVIRRKRWGATGWILSQIVIWTSAFFIILYGLKLGKVVSQLWLTSAMLCFIHGIFISGPTKIMAFAVVLALFGEMYDVTTYECDIEAAKKTHQIGDMDILRHVLTIRALPSYHPVNIERTNELRALQAKRNHRSLYADFLLTIVFFVVLLNFTGNLYQVRKQYINSHLTQKLTSRYMKTPGLQDIYSPTTLTDYLIAKLLPGIFKDKWYNHQTLTSPEESLANMGWISDTVHRMVGVPRFRQIRVTEDKFPFRELFNDSKAVCFPGLSIKTEDRSDYGLFWGPITKYINKPLRESFMYHNETGDGSINYGASGNRYHSGGYIVTLKDTHKESNTIISDLIDNKWLDIRMRAFIIELSVYNPNTDSQSLVTIIIEHLPSGAFESRFEITTIHLYTQIAHFLLFCCILIVFNVQLVIRVNRTGIGQTLSHFWSLYDIVLMALSNIAVLAELTKMIRAVIAVQVFQQDTNTDFFYFSDIVLYERNSVKLWSIVLCVIPLRIFKFDFFVSACKVSCYTLYRGRNTLASVTLLLCVIMSYQIHVIYHLLNPANHPMDLEFKYYESTWKSHSQIINNNELTLVAESLLLAVTSYMGFIILQMIIVHLYKILRDN